MVLSLNIIKIRLSHQATQLLGQVGAGRSFYSLLSNADLDQHSTRFSQEIGMKSEVKIAEMSPSSESW